MCVYVWGKADDGDHRDSGVGDGAFQGQWDMARWDEVKVQGRRPGVCGWSVGGEWRCAKESGRDGGADAGTGGRLGAMGSGQDLHCLGRREERRRQGAVQMWCSVGWEGRAVVGSKLGQRRMMAEGRWGL